MTHVASFNYEVSIPPACVQKLGGNRLCGRVFCPDIECRNEMSALNIAKTHSGNIYPEIC